MSEEIERGQVWKWKKTTRPDIEIVSYNKYNGKIYWRYQGEKMDYDSDIKSFLDNFERKT